MITLQSLFAPPLQEKYNPLAYIILRNYQGDFIMGRVSIFLKKQQALTCGHHYLSLLSLNSLLDQSKFENPLPMCTCVAIFRAGLFKAQLS